MKRLKKKIKEDLYRITIENLNRTYRNGPTEISYQDRNSFYIIDITNFNSHDIALFLPKSKEDNGELWDYEKFDIIVRTWRYLVNYEKEQTEDT